MESGPKGCEWPLGAGKGNMWLLRLSFRKDAVLLTGAFQLSETHFRLSGLQTIK